MVEITLVRQRGQQGGAEAHNQTRPADSSLRVLVLLGQVHRPGQHQ